MMRRSTIIRTVVIIAASVLVSYAQAPTGLKSLPSSAYEHVYRHLLHLKAVDAAAAASGKRSDLSAYYKNLANLTQAQADAMASLSQAAVADLNVLDQRPRR